MRANRRLLFVLPLLLVVFGLSFAGRKAEPKTDDQLAFGLAMAKRGLWNEALFRFRLANQERPNDGKILNNMAVAFEAVGRFEEALASYQKALKSDPGNRDLKKNYSRFLEFYQGFQPEEEAAAAEAADSAPGSAAETASEDAADDAAEVLVAPRAKGGR